jgi:hypothetical protein
LGGAVASDPGPMARFEELKLDADAPGEVFRLLTDGKTLKEIAKAWRVPKGRFVEWYTVEHADLYDSALKVLADELAHGALERADGATEGDVAPRKLQVDTRLKLIEKWDRARYGAQVKVDHGGAVAVDAGLLGTVVEMLAAARAKRGIVVEAVPEPLEPMAELPAPAEQEKV